MREMSLLGGAREVGGQKKATISRGSGGGERAGHPWLVVTGLLCVRHHSRCLQRPVFLGLVDLLVTAAAAAALGPVETTGVHGGER